MSLTRGYSVLTVKSVNDDARTFVGVASTPSTDRDGDILVPAGAQFKLPLPLLLRHNQDEPVGWITAARVVAAEGIEVTGQITKVTQPGRVKDRVDDAWTEVKSGLMRGLSVGFKALEAKPIERTGGIKFLKWLWLELSLVTIPANQDATILAIKQCDTNAASGVTVPATRAASGVSRSHKAPMKISEQLTAKKADLKTKAARLETLHTADDPTAEQIEERDTLTDEVKALTNDVDRLSVLEKAMASGEQGRVVPVAPQPGQNGGDSRPFEVNEPKLDKGIEFARMVICKVAGRLNGMSPLDVAKSAYPNNGRLQLALKTAIAPGVTTDNAWAGYLVDPTNLISEFIEYLRPMTIIGKFGTGNIPSLRRVPFNVRMIGQTSGGAAQWVGENKAKPLTKFDFAPTTLTWAVIAAIAVISKQLARFSSPSAEATVRDAIAGAIVERQDTDFVDPDKAVDSGVSPASITNTAVAIPATGTSAEALRADLATLIGRFIDANIDLAQGVFIMPSAVALNLSLMRNALGNREFNELSMRGGVLEGFPVITSQYASVASPVNNMIILAAANEIFLSDDGQVSIEMSDQASLEMSNNPEGESGTVVSMFQNNLIALRAERYINWAKRRAAAVQYISNANYSPVTE